jgi:hypothetical protein
MSAVKISPESERLQNEVTAPPTIPPENLLQPPGKPPANGGGAFKKEEVTKKQSGLFNFSNTEAIKEKVRQRKAKGAGYNVENFYHEKGIFQKIARNTNFINVTLGVIVLNAMWISVDTDYNKGEAIFSDFQPIFIIADVGFFGYFSFELFVRFMAFKRKRDCLKDGWFKFDTTLVTLYLFDPFILGLMALGSGGGVNLPTAVLRLARLARLSRLVRMLKAFPELMIMIKGMVSAINTVSYVFLLLMIATYVFSIAIRNLVPADSYLEEAYFSKVWETAHKLILHGTFLDALSDFMYAVMGHIPEDDTQDPPRWFADDEPPDIVRLKAAYLPVWFLVWLYIIIACLAILNMLIGVLCEVISSVAAEEREAMIVDQVREKVGDIVNRLDENSDGTLTWEEFCRIFSDDVKEEAIAALECVNVDAANMVDVAEDFFFDHGKPVAVSFDEFMNMVLDLRGGQEATVKDIMSLGKHFNRNMMRTKKEMDDLDGKFDRVLSKMSMLFGQ